MKLGAFSISLSVKDLSASREFYEKLGFAVFGGEESQNWLIMKNGDAVIGLFQGMFPQNIITFNPGWDQGASPVNPYDDIRRIREELVSQGLSLDGEMDAEGAGPASMTLTDPDGNPILIDQHR